MLTTNPQLIFYISLRDSKIIIVTTNYIVDETYTLLMRRAGKNLAVDFIDAMRKTFNVYYVTETDEDEAIEFLKKYSDKNFTFTDAISFIYMKRNKIRNAFAFDKHFIQAGFKTLPEIIR